MAIPENEKNILRHGLKNAEMRRANLAMPRVVALMIASLVLASCSGGIIGDYAPQWAGGFPKDLPPRQGTPEYDAWRKKKEAEADRDKSKDPPPAKADSPGIAGLPK